MSGHGTNTIFFDKKKKDWTFRTLGKPLPPTSDIDSFLPDPPTPPQRRSHMCVTPNLREP